MLRNSISRNPSTDPILLGAVKRLPIQLPTLTGSAAAQHAREIAGEIRRRGFVCYMVGGAVRDALLGRTPEDVDLATSALPEDLAKIFPEWKNVGAAFGVSMVGETEIATFRQERVYLDGRHPEQIRYTRDYREDAIRRDFTVNALYYDPFAEELLDPCGGMADLQRGVIRAVGNAEERFREDALRMLRAVRFAAGTGFALAQETAAAIRTLAGNCKVLAAERVRSEVEKILLGNDPARGMEQLADLGLLEVLLPEVAAMRGVTQPPQFHPEGDVWQHTVLMLRHMRDADAPLAWSVLLHDVGKPVTRSVEANGRIRFFNHETVGSTMAGEILYRLHASRDLIHQVVEAVRSHMSFVHLDRMRPATLRRILGDPLLPLKMELVRLDCISCHGLMDDYCFLLDELAARAGAVRMPDPLLRGRDLIAAGYLPGPEFSRWLAKAYELQLSGAVTTAEEALAAVRLWADLK
ncbi:MAG: HD domain-containing protein [Lentisphaeria bacterium]|nr:HD domain-containing protein [Lentisphaeria bacterium]